MWCPALTYIALLSWSLGLLGACRPTAAAMTPTSPTPRPAAPAPTGATATAPGPLVQGETFALTSTVLGERRVINVYLPPGYRADGPPLPTLYLLDGGVHEDFPHVTGIVDVSIKNQVIRPMIVVGLENTERRRDLVGPSQHTEDLELAPHAGGADRFRQFLREELKPYVAAHYRVSGESALIGESFAGLFVVETLLLAPDLFDSYLAVSPSLWWNQQALVLGAATHLAAWTPALTPRRLYLATADEQEIQAGAELLTAALRQRSPAGLTWQYQPLPDEHHHTVFPVAAIKGVRALFAIAP